MVDTGTADLISARADSGDGGLDLAVAWPGTINTFAASGVTLVACDKPASLSHGARGPVSDRRDQVAEGLALQLRRVL